MTTIQMVIMILPLTGMVPFQSGVNGQMIQEPLDEHPLLQMERRADSFCTSATNWETGTAAENRKLLVKMSHCHF